MARAVPRSTPRRPTPAMPVPRRALLSVSDKSGLADLGRGLVARGWELVSTGGTARALREAGLPVTDVAAVTGFPEMLDGRVKTLHPRVHGGLLADRRRADHREALLAAGIAPFDLVVVNLYPFAEAARKPGLVLRRPRRGDRHRRAVDGARGREEPRQRGDRDVARALRRGPRRRSTSTARSRSACAPPSPSRRSATPRPTTRGSPRSCRAAWPPPASSFPRSPACPARRTRTRRSSRSRWRRWRPSATARTPTSRPRATAGRTASRAPRDGPFATGEPPLQGKALSYNNVLDASAAAALGRLMRGPAIVICKHTNPCGAAERPTLLEAWEAALAGDPVSAFGGVVAVTGHRRPAAGRAARIDLPRGRGRAGVRRGRPGGAGDQAQPAPRRGRLAGRRRRVSPPPTRWARSAPPAAASSSPRPTPSPTIRPPGRAPRRAGPPRPSCGTSTSPGVSAGASSRTRSSSSATGCSWVSARAR